MVNFNFGLGDDQTQSDNSQSSSNSQNDAAVAQNASQSQNTTAEPATENVQQTNLEPAPVSSESTEVAPAAEIETPAEPVLAEVDASIPVASENSAENTIDPAMPQKPEISTPAEDSVPQTPTNTAEESPFNINIQNQTSSQQSPIAETSPTPEAPATIIKENTAPLPSSVESSAEEPGLPPIFEPSNGDEMSFNPSQGSDSSPEPVVAEETPTAEPPKAPAEQGIASETPQTEENISFTPSLEGAENSLSAEPQTEQQIPPQENLAEKTKNISSEAQENTEESQGIDLSAMEIGNAAEDQEDTSEQVSKDVSEEKIQSETAQNGSQVDLLKQEIQNFVTAKEEEINSHYEEIEYHKNETKTHRDAIKNIKNQIKEKKQEYLTQLEDARKIVESFDKKS